MPYLAEATPRCSVYLFKTIDRRTTDGSTAASERYKGKDPYIDLTPFLGDGSSVRTSKSVREASGGFVVTFTDQAQADWKNRHLESVYGLVEPMDVIEIRMWRGIGALPLDRNYPIIMRGFVSEVTRGQAMGQDGRPQRTVTISGQDYGKIWQTYQVLFMPAYKEGKPLLTSYALTELFGVKAVNAMKAGEFVRTMIEKVINPHIEGFLPATLPVDIPKKIQTGNSIAVQHGKVNMSFQQAQGQGLGSIYDILKTHGDVGHWNELYTEDREDGVHCVYRPVPYFKLSNPDAPTKERMIHEDAPIPPACPIYEHEIESITSSRTDATVYNFFWVNNSKFDLIDDTTRRLYALKDNKDSDARDYPNASAQYYGVRALNAETQQGDDEIENMTGGLPKDEHEKRGKRMEAWIQRRLRQLKESNQDNVVYERGTARVKGCPMRPDGVECMKPGDYAVFKMGDFSHPAYVYQIEHEFIPYQGYTTTLTFDRSEGFALRMETDFSPYLIEQVGG